MQTRPVRADVPTGISRQAKISPAAKPHTFQSGRNTVPWRHSHSTSGMTEIDTAEMIEPSYIPAFSSTSRRRVP